MSKPDRRIQRTRRQLREALISLILERGYDTVTVEDITGQADLGRTTFYLHYKDKEELLLDSIQVIADELRAQVWVDAVGGQLLPANSNEAIRMVFELAAANSRLYRIILSGGAASKVLALVRGILTEGALQFYSMRQPQSQPGIPMEMLANYFSSALLGFLTWWLENGMPYSPEQMASTFSLLFVEGARQMVGEPQRSVPNEQA